MFRNFSTPQDVKKAVDNLYQTKLKEFRAAAYDTGYYAARLESNLSDTDRAEYTALHRDSLALRGRIHGDLLHMGAHGNTR